MRFRIYPLIILFVFAQSACSVGNIAPLDSTAVSLIVYESRAQSETSSGGKSSSNSSSAVLERNIGNREGGLELEYSFPQENVPLIEAWKFPARVLKVPGSSIELLNTSEIESRLENFLDQNPDVRKLCGETIFTWDAFDIHCNASHVLDIIKFYDLHFGELSEGKLYNEPGMVEAVPLTLKSSSKDMQVFQANLTADPEHLQTEYETSMKKVANIVGDSFESVISSDLELKDGDKPTFSGTRIVTIEVASTGLVVRLEREIITIIKGGANFQETQTTKQVLERRPVE